MNVFIIAKMKIALISDTHGFLEPKAIKYLEGADEIWHAGDIGNLELLDQLAEIKKTRAVYGNIDDHRVRRTCPEDQYFDCQGIRVFITHIAAKPPRYNPRVLSKVNVWKPNVLICGHSHILKVMPDKVNNLLFMNPGALGNHGFHKVKTMLRFEITNGMIEKLEAIELGKRGHLNPNL